MVRQRFFFLQESAPPPFQLPLLVGIVESSIRRPINRSVFQARAKILNPLIAAGDFTPRLPIGDPELGNSRAALPESKTRNYTRASWAPKPRMKASAEAHGEFDGSVESTVSGSEIKGALSERGGCEIGRNTPPVSF